MGGGRIESIGSFFVPEEHIPKPEQLRKVTSTALIIARQTNKLLEVSNDSSTPAYFWVDARLGPNDEVGSDEYMSRSARYQRRPNVPASFGAEGGLPVDGCEDASSGVSSLRYRQIQQHRLIGDHWRGELRQYAFEWNDKGVIKSECRVSEVPSVEATEAEFVYQQMLEEYKHLDEGDDSDLDFQLRLIAGEQTSRTVQFVSRDECARLLGVMRRVRSGENQLIEAA